MGIEFEDRPSESPYIERVWRSWSDSIDRMTSIASAHWTLVCWRDGRSWRVAAQGPETVASSAPVPQEAEFIGIRLALGMTPQQLPIGRLVDGAVEFPDVSRQSVRLFGDTVPLLWWYEDAEDVVHRLVGSGAVAHDPMIADVLRGWSPNVTARTVRRHFLSAAGVTHGAVRQIERARNAALLLRTGAAIADVTHQLGYYDQPHLARSLARFIGHTGSEVRGGSFGQLSLLYKT